MESEDGALVELVELLEEAGALAAPHALEAHRRALLPLSLAHGRRYLVSHPRCRCCFVLVVRLRLLAPHAMEAHHRTFLQLVEDLQDYYHFFL